MNSLKVGIKYCGHCQPQMDTKELYEQLLLQMKDAEFFYFALNENVDILLILNACQVGCASRPKFHGRTIIVTPNEVDYWPVEKQDIVRKVIEKIRKY